jgi:hypothetical protein
MKIVKVWGNRSKIFFLLLLTLTLCSYRSNATHLRAADILVERICGTLTFKITIVAYLNSGSQTNFGTNSQVYFGDNTFVQIPLTFSTPRPDLGTNVSIATFSTTHTYAASGIYTISYMERDRSSGVLNIANSHDVPYVTSLKIDTNPALGCNKVPVLSVVPLDRGCSKIIFYHNPGAFDVDGDSLSYELSVPMNSITTFAAYDDPNKAKFYSNFAAGNEAGNGPPVFTIDPLTGQITWDAPGAIGEYNIAFKVIEWKKNPDGNYVQASVTTRDMQIIIEPCQNTRPDLIIPDNICILAGQTLQSLIKGVDAEDHPVKIEVFSELVQLSANPATYSPNPPEFRPSEPPAEMIFEWSPECIHVRQQSYQVVFKITDLPPSGPKLVTFKTWNIRVIAPPPNLTNAAIDVVKNYGVIEWSQTCENVSAIQVWRKVESFNYTPGACDIGIPKNAGYKFVGQVASSQASFTDTNFGMGLSPGATYCYRLVGLLADTRTQVSGELCIGPVKPDAPVITHVSITQTADSGKIQVSWRSPLEINKVQFPEPYRYEIYRASDFIGNVGITRAGETTDTTFLDQNIDTKDSVFNYRIVLYSKPEFSTEFIPVDTSAIASTVRLSATPGKGQISLHWQDSVPWSNVVQNRPYHLIYRGNGMASDDELILLDSINVLENGFEYVDTSVDSTELYAYKILTRGTYGNPKIAIQMNFSQMVFSYPQNSFRPCSPLVTIDKENCDDYLNSTTCDVKIFNNSVTWTIEPQQNCRKDIVSYNVYASNPTDTVLTLISSTAFESFNHSNLSSALWCYRISAVDQFGNESLKSDQICNDNCPFFTLPNVITPNDDGCNDVFTSRPDRGTNVDCTSNLSACPRFVKAVALKIYNRWGKQVYSYDSRDSGSTDIDWPGVDDNGKELPGGVYYYVAELDFDVMNVNESHQVYKDWVHILR